MSGMILALVGIVGEFKDTDAAEAAMADFADVYPDKFLESVEDDPDQDWTFGEAEKVTMPRLGDKRRASIVTGSAGAGGFSISAYMSTTSVQIDNLVQVVFAFSISEPSIEAVSDAAEGTDGRWPDKSKVKEADGVHTGGIWSALPTEDDVPAGLVVGDDFELEF